MDANGAWKVRVPAAAAPTRGTTWGDGLTAGRTLDLSEFHIARPGDSVQSINSQLARGKNLLLTPGVYDINRSIDIKRPGTVVLGMGHATPDRRERRHPDHGVGPGRHRRRRGHHRRRAEEQVLN